MPSVVRPLPQMPESLPLPDALSRLRRDNSHLALVTAPDGSVTAMVALEDLVEDLVGAMRDGTHRADRIPRLRSPRKRESPSPPVCSTKPTGSIRERAHRSRVDAFLEPHLRRARAGEAHPVWDFLFTYYSLRPRQLRRWHPGYGVVLGGAAARRYLGRTGYGRTTGRCHGDRASTCWPASTPSGSSPSCCAPPPNARRG